MGWGARGGGGEGGVPGGISVTITDNWLVTSFSKRSGGGMPPNARYENENGG
jgi:hypothetical protein